MFMCFQVNDGWRHNLSNNAIFKLHDHIHVSYIVTPLVEHTMFSKIRDSDAISETEGVLKNSR